MMRNRVLLATLLLAACAPPVTRPPAVEMRDPESLVMAMRARYPRWYYSAAFTQRTTLRRDGKVEQQAWRTYLAADRLRMEDVFHANGRIHDGDSLFIIRDRELVAAREERNRELLVLVHDLYALPADQALAQLADAGYLPGALRADTFEGEPAWVVSTTDAAGRTHEMWVEARRLLPMRFVEPGPAGVTLDMRLEKYRRNGGGWLAGRVDVRVDGRSVELAEIGSARYNLGFPEWTWDPERWRLGVAVNPYSRGDHVGLDFPNPGLWGH